MGKMTPKKYVKGWRKLVELERQEEMEHHEEEIRRLSGFQRQARGRALMQLRGRDDGLGLGGYRLVKFRSHPATPLPDTEIETGDLVLASRGDPLARKNPVGTVAEKTRYSVTVSFARELPPWVTRSRGHRLRLDLYVNDVTYQRMLEALETWSQAQGRLTHLRRVLLGQRPPLFGEESSPRDYYFPQLNPSQQSAVSRALAAADCFLIHGPPGTGKTVTMVELACQLVGQGERVLAAADSNTAVDNLVEMLAEYSISVVRVGHPARVSPLLRQHTLDYQVQQNRWYQAAQTLREQVDQIRSQQEQVAHPGARWRRGLSDRKIRVLARRGQGARGVSAQRLQEMARWLDYQRKVDEGFGEIRRLENKAVAEIMERARVVCATNSTCGSEIVRQQNFDSVIVDEATQATEPSSLIPLARGGRFYLAGDHKQLPPTVLSREAEERGLGLSLFQRLLQLHGDGVKALLTIQYRMHREIMAFPNDQFYRGLLHAHASVAAHTLDPLLTASPGSNLSLPWPGLLAGDKPLVWIALTGPEKQRAGSTSRHNDREAAVAAMLARELIQSGLPPSELGIITPYDDQAQLLRQAGSWPRGLEIKTVDGFQGREKEAVIISFVRSNDAGNLGFLLDLRRLNVALTRARRKLILVGDPTTLSHDPVYAELVQACRQRQCLAYPGEEELPSPLSGNRASASPGR